LDVTDRSAALLQIEKLGLFPVSVEASRAGAVVGVADGAATGEKRDWKEMLPPALRVYFQRQRGRSCRSWRRSRSNWRTC